MKRGGMKRQAARNGVGRMFKDETRYRCARGGAAKRGIQRGISVVVSMAEAQNVEAAKSAEVEK